MKPTPVGDDRDTRGMFEAASRGAIGVQYCTVCDRARALPRRFCPACGSIESEWRDLPARGRVYSFTVVEHQVHPDFEVPYTILLIELDVGSNIRLVGHLDGRPEIRIDDPVYATFDDVRDGVTVASWHLAHDSGAR